MNNVMGACTRERQQKGVRVWLRGSFHNNFHMWWFRSGWLVECKAIYLPIHKDFSHATFTNQTLSPGMTKVCVCKSKLLVCGELGVSHWEKGFTKKTENGGGHEVGAHHEGEHADVAQHAPHWKVSTTP
jgi:hypothetical protein